MFMVFERAAELEQMKLSYVIGVMHGERANFKIDSSDFLVEAKKRVAIKTVQRRGRIHDYMEQWGYRWIDARMQPRLVRAMIYDPITGWDENSRAIASGIARYFDHISHGNVQADLLRLAA